MSKIKKYFLKMTQNNNKETHVVDNVIVSAIERSSVLHIKIEDAWYAIHVCDAFAFPTWLFIYSFV